MSRQRTDAFQLDVLDTFETIRVATAYKIDGEVSFLSVASVWEDIDVVAGTRLLSGRSGCLGPMRCCVQGLPGMAEADYEFVVVLRFAKTSACIRGGTVPAVVKMNCADELRSLSRNLLESR